MKYVKMGIVHHAWPWPLSDESIEEIIELIGELSDVEIFRMIAGINKSGMKEGWLVKESGGGKPMLVSNFTFEQDYKLLSEVLEEAQNAVPRILASRQMIRSMFPGGKIISTGEPDLVIEPLNIEETQRSITDQAFHKDLAALLNSHSLENRYNVPDYLLARMIMEHLNSLEALLNETSDKFPEAI